MHTLNNVPLDVALHILSFLEPKDVVVAVRQVCVEMFRVFQDGLRPPC